jgi:hypothetical protein
MLVPAQAAGEVGGRVAMIQGEALAQLNRTRRVLAANGDVFVGDRISTGEGARAMLRLGRATDLRLGALTRVTIDKFIVDAGGTISLGEGALLLDKTPGGPQVDIRSPYGLIAVRGTEIFAGPSRGVFGVLVLRGQVTVSGGGKQVVLGAGQGTDIARPGAAPTDPATWGQPRVGAALTSVY